VRVDRVGDLLCNACGVRGPHELLYLNEHLLAHRCMSCGSTTTYSRHLYTDYALDVGVRSAHLPGRLAQEARQGPRRLLSLPGRAARKPFRLAGELRRLAGFTARRRDDRGEA
jgi:hypothetical protein